MDRIFIKDLILPCTIGVTEEERRSKHNICLNISILIDLSVPRKTDNLQDTLDYRSLADKISLSIANSEYHLLETLAEKVAQICLEDPRVMEVKVTVEKLTGIENARSAGVEITLKR